MEQIQYLSCIFCYLFLFLVRVTKHFVSSNPQFTQKSVEVSTRESNRECDDACCDTYLHDNDAITVIELLGLDAKNTSGDGVGVEGAYVLLQEKESSLDELEQAFAVFDTDGDGFISSVELMSVMSKLRLGEGMEKEDFERMIGAFDKDCDGKINFEDFKLLLEDAI